MTDDNEQHLKVGPTGPNNTWRAGDHYHNGMLCVTLTALQAEEINQHVAEKRAQAMAGELSRLNFDPTRPCIKCKCTFPARICYCPEKDECSVNHGESEHFDRQCHRCGHVWAENLP